MSEELCDYSDLPKSQCAHCTGATLHEDEKPMPRPERVSGGVVVAVFNGVCPACGEGIEKGEDHIVKSGPSWIHYGCS